MSHSTVDALLWCPNHRAAAATIRCDECHRPYCRECVLERWVTSRSSVWVCRRCAGGWQPNGAGGRSILPASLSRVAPLGLVIAIAAIAAALQSGLHIL